jgi:hypothetical protein
VTTPATKIPAASSAKAPAAPSWTIPRLFSRRGSRPRAARKRIARAISAALIATTRTMAITTITV